MATIVRRKAQDGSPVWRVQVRRKGFPSQSATFTQLSEARRCAQMTEGAIVEGRHFPNRQAKRRTLADALDRYEQDTLHWKAPGTVAKQQQILRWWRSQLGYAVLADLTPALLTEYRDKLVRHLAPATVNLYLDTLSHVLATAVREWEWLNKSPMRRVSKLREPRGRVRFLSEGERERLLAACRESNSPHLYPVVVLALSTGACKTEIQTLLWDSVDLKRGLIRLVQTKNGERRAVPLTGYARELLRQLATDRRFISPYVFPGANGKAVHTLWTAWRTALRKARIVDFRFHDLRHSAASYLAMSGANLSEIAEVLGHKSLQMTRRYAHLSEAHTRSIVERMNQSIFNK